MNTQQAQNYQAIYRKTFSPLALSFIFIYFIGVLWDYTSFIASQKSFNDRVMSGIQSLTKARMRYIEQEAKIVDIRITHVNTLNKVIQALGMPAFKVAKRSKNSIFTSIFFIPEKDKRFSLSPYGILDAVDFPKEILKKLPIISIQGEFYLWDNTLYYMRRVKHPHFKQYDGVLILLCEVNELIDTEYKPDDINILLSTNTYSFLQPDKLERTYGPLPSSITISGNIYNHYAIIPETSLILFVKLQEVNAYKIYIKQRPILWAALSLLLLLLLAYHLTFNLLFLKKISKLRHKTSIEEQYEQSIKERERILKEVFLRQQEHIRVLIDSYCLTSSHIDGSLYSDTLTPQSLEELNLTVARASDALEDGILLPSKIVETDVSASLHKSILFLFHAIYTKEINISFQQSVPGVIQHDRLVIELLFINIINNLIKRSPHAGFINIFMKINNDALMIEIIDQGYIHDIKSFTHDFYNKRADLFCLDNERLLKLAAGANINIEVKNELAPPKNTTVIVIPLKAFSTEIEEVVHENVIQFRGK